MSAGWHLLEQPDGYAHGNDPYFQSVAVPPGEPLVQFLAYLPADEVLFGPKGGGRHFKIPGRQRSVPIGRYYRLTRPDEPLPDWLTASLFESPYEGPGHEDEWEEIEDDDEAEDDLFHVIRLSPAGEELLRKPREPWRPFEIRTRPKCPPGLGVPVDGR